MKKIFIFFLAAFFVFSLSACGKSALPTPYPDSGYPHSYPHHH